MDQENKTTTGAPQSDTTSALFVSARKKQLEQQEVDRRAKEKEEQRLAAEAEVRRLEREVEERRRKTEEDAKRAEEEAKQVAAESRAKMAQAAENPDAVLGAQPVRKEIKLPQMPKISMPQKQEKPAKADASSSGGVATAVKAPLNVKLLAMIGGGVVLVALVIILIVTLGGGGGGSSELENNYVSNSLGFEFAYPSGWTVEEDAALNSVTLQSETGVLMLADATPDLNAIMNEYGVEAVTAADMYMREFLAGVGFSGDDMPDPTLQQTGDYVTGSVELFVETVYISMDLEVIADRAVMYTTITDESEMEDFIAVATEIELSLAVTPADGSGDVADEGYEEGGDTGSGGSFSNSFISFEYPADWYVSEDIAVGNAGGLVLVSSEPGGGDGALGSTPLMFISDYTEAFNNNSDKSYETILGYFTEDFDLASQLGEPTSTEYLGEFPATAGPGTECGMVLRYGDVAVMSQLAFMDSGVAYGSFTIGFDLSEEINNQMNGILSSMAPVQG